MTDNGETQLACRGDFWAVNDRRYLEVDVDDFGRIRTQSLTAGEFTEYFKMDADPARTAEKHAWIVCHCLVDENGARIFRDADKEGLMSRDAGLILSIATVCYAHCQNFGDLEKKVGELVASGLTE